MSENAATTASAAPAAAKPRRWVRTLVTLVILGGGGGGGFMYYRKVSTEKAAAAKKAAEEKKKPTETLVRVSFTRKARVARRELYVGELAPAKSVELAPKASGRLLKVMKVLGDRVQKNELVALIDDAEIVKQIDEANSAIEVARAQVDRAEAELVRAESELKRKQPLYKEQLITRQEMENLESAVAVAKASLTLAKAQVVQSQTRVATLKVQLDNTRVTAPFAGRVNKRYIDPGTMVTSLNAIYQVVTDQKILARFRVPERDLRELPVGKKVSIQVETYPGESFEGKVVRISPAVDTTTRTAIGEAHVPTKGGRLKPGMFARVEVLWSVAKDVILAPQRALVRPPDDPQGKAGVFVREKGTARFVPVGVGAEQGDDVEVTGLRAGVELIVEGQHGLKTGNLVVLAPPEGADGGVASSPTAADKAPARSGPTQAAPPAAGGTAQKGS
jgi:RND family efflux transporter MFP subunit